MRDITTTPVSDLNDGQAVSRLRFGHAIVGDDGKSIPHLLALDHGFAVHVPDGWVEVHRAPYGAKSNPVAMPAEEILRLADWLRSRGHRLPEEG